MYDRDEDVLQDLVALERRYKQDMFWGVLHFVWDETLRVA